ncbi:dienelactone hydrolase family protein [Parapedobacter deserti]|uniref:Dienelactone hydrolase family protein n=1 Tax=Parapedobacter deserti TaxID=1912957 RepID=A0ABV7JRY0_9SPHI
MYIKTALLSFVLSIGHLAHGQQIPFDHKPLAETEQLTGDMVSSIHRFLDRYVSQVTSSRDKEWAQHHSVDDFHSFVASKRVLLAKQLGVVDKRLEPEMLGYYQATDQQTRVQNKGYRMEAVHWNVLEGLSASGLVIYPKGPVKGRAVLVPDAGMPPEHLAGIVASDLPGFARAQRLASQGWMVVIPLLVDLGQAYAGNATLGLHSSLTHREWIYRQAYMLGRHVIGYELQKIFAAIDWLEQLEQSSNSPIGVAGYGEGGMLALYAAALDPRIATTVISGYFNNRSDLWQEPVYRNVFGLLKDFGDAELAAMCWPRKLVIEHALVDSVTSFGGRGAPGRIGTPDTEKVWAEFVRAKAIVPENQPHLNWVADGQSPLSQPFSDQAISLFANSNKLRKTQAIPTVNEWIDSQQLQQNNVVEMTALVQRVLQLCENARDSFFWDNLKGDYTNQEVAKDSLRTLLWNQIGKLPIPSGPLNTEACILEKNERWTSYVVKLNVWDEVFTWGILVVPNAIKPGEQRPVVVCQHGLEQSPYYLINTNTATRQYDYFKAMPLTLAENGYITFMPANPYVGDHYFRQIQRKANPLGLSMFSFITGQHQRIIEWLKSLQFVNDEKIGFFGLSYGGTTALRVPAIVTDYKLSICVANFNQWVKKCASIDIPFSYMYNSEYEIQDWDFGHTFDTAEKVALIAPRPFMAQRGSFDNVGRDDMVAGEHAKVRRHYMLSGLPEDYVPLTYFVGGHITEEKSALKFIYRFLPLN